MMFGIVDVKNSNAEIFMKYYIDDTTTISSNFTKFQIRKFFKERKYDADAQERTKKNSKKNENKNSEKVKEKKTDE